jgi:hypothetical protein
MAGSTAIADSDQDGHATGDIAPIGPLTKRDVLVVRSDVPALAEIAMLWMGIEHGLQESRGGPVQVVAASSPFGSLADDLSLADGMAARPAPRPHIRRLLRHRPFNWRKRNVVSSAEKTVSIVFRAVAGSAFKAPRAARIAPGEPRASSPGHCRPSRRT